MNELALFAGAGGGILGGHLLGWRTVCAVEINAYARSVLLARQNDGTLAPFPVWDDIRTFDGRAWRGLVDVVSGGFPCTDISAAGKGTGIEGEHSGLWREMARVVGEVRPQFVFIENSPLLRIRGFEQVQEDLAEMGYGCKWGVVGAHHVGAHHKRDRMWVVAYANGLRELQPQGFKQIERGRTGDGCSAFSHTDRKQHQSQSHAWSGQGETQRIPQLLAHSECQCDGTEKHGREAYGAEADRSASRPGGSSRWPTEPAVGRVANGVAHRVDRLKALGNGQVPRVAATASRVLTDL